MRPLPDMASLLVHEYFLVLVAAIVLDRGAQGQDLTCAEHDFPNLHPCLLSHFCKFLSILFINFRLFLHVLFFDNMGFLLCSSEFPETHHRSACLFLSSAGIKGLPLVKGLPPCLANGETLSTSHI